MAYFLFNTNTPYNSTQMFNCDTHGYIYTTFDTLTNYGTIIPNSSFLSLSTSYLQSNWFPSQINLKDTNEIVQESVSLKQCQKDKNSSQKKINLRSRNLQKQLQSAKKNSQSNLVNQFLSYFSSITHSHWMILKTLNKMNLSTKNLDKKQLDQIITFFCKQVAIVNSRRQRKYVNKIQKLDKYMPDILQKVDKFNLITRQQFCELFRRVCYHFFRTISLSSVTSSAKLNPISRPEHIKRRRLIVQTLGKK